MLSAESAKHGVHPSCIISCGPINATRRLMSVLGVEDRGVGGGNAEGNIHL